MDETLANVAAPCLSAESNDDALATLERAVHARPDDARAWFDLGVALNHRNCSREALRALDCALTLVPYQIDATCERGIALLALRSLEDAADAFEEVLASHPLHGAALFSLGNVRYRQGRLEEAAALWRRAADLLEDPVDALENLAIACQRLHLPDQERAVCHELLTHQPNHPVALHQLATLGEAAMPPRASDAYIIRLFDAFADEFDTSLSALGYCAPQLLAGLIEELLDKPGAALDALDGGCGTGLCGEWLRPWARQLTGVDLSGGMLAKARERGLYDQLVQAELIAYLAIHPAEFDLIVSSDTLNYFGALEEVMAAAAHTLRPGGWLVFTLEKMPSSVRQADYHLEPHGRYRHAGDYVRRTLERAGLYISRMNTDTIRFESGQPVDGWLVVARRKQGPSQSR